MRHCFLLLFVLAGVAATADDAALYEQTRPSRDGIGKKRSDGVSVQSRYVIRLEKRVHNQLPVCVDTMQLAIKHWQEAVAADATPQPVNSRWRK